MKLDSTFRKIYAIPDIHGRSDLLDQALILLDKDGYDEKQDLLVFLGDMIDRGPDSKGVIDLVIKLQEDNPQNVIALRGNHESFAIQTGTTGEARDLWYWNGGLNTEASYPTKKMSEEHVKWLAALPTSVEVQGFFFSHAPVPRDKARSGLDRPWSGTHFGRPGEPYTLWEKTWHYFGPESEKTGGMMDVHEGARSEDGTGSKFLTGVCGHIHRGPHRKTVRIFPKYRMLDCGCGCFENSPLAVHECISGQTFYANQIPKF